jgi:hypothetical protein
MAARWAAAGRAKTILLLLTPAGQMKSKKEKKSFQVLMSR